MGTRALEPGNLVTRVNPLVTRAVTIVTRGAGRYKNKTVFRILVTRAVILQHPGL